MTHEALVQRLSEASVRKHHDAHADIAWDDGDMRIELDDPRWALDPTDPLGRTRWYQAQPERTRARIGLHLVVAQMSLGVTFERVLSMGLFELMDTLSLDSAELRYAYHEVIEESQHSLMFAEFVRRSGLEPIAVGAFERWMSRRVARMGRRFPELFFFFVLAGEAPIDCAQRRMLQRRAQLHPLVRRIMQIHVTEEARHLSFAESCLRERVPRLSWPKLTWLRLRAPIIMKVMSEQMLRPPASLVDRYRIPEAVVREAYDGPEHRHHVLDGLSDVRRLCEAIGVVTPWSRRIWRALGIWPTASPAQPACL